MGFWSKSKSPERNGNGVVVSQDGEPNERSALLGNHEASTQTTAPIPAQEPRVQFHPIQQAQLQSRYRPTPEEEESITPYNFKSVRVLRYFTIFFTCLTSIWVILLLISLFATPPGMAARGSGFVELVFALCTFLILLIEVLFYAVPSGFSVAVSCVLVILLLVDSILAAALNSLRYDLGWVGIATIFWTALMSVWVVFCGRMVEASRELEEERVRGTPETRRTLGEWGGVFISSILVVAMLCVAVLLTANLGLKAKDASLPYPGKRVGVDNFKYKLHIYCSPMRNDSTADAPTVLIEGGEVGVQNGLESIVLESHQDGLVPRYCYWDRPGMGFSDNAPSPLSAGMAVDALSEGLARLGENGPWVIVSAGVGSIYTHVFAARHAERVRSIILLDPLPPTIPHLNNVGRAMLGFRYFAEGLLTPLGIPNLFSAIFRGVTRENRVFGHAARHTGRFLKLRLQENTVATTFTANELGAAREVLKNKGVDVVLISSKDMMKHKQWAHGQEAMSRGAGGGKVKEWAVVEGGHEIWWSKEGRRVIRIWLSRLLDKRPDGIMM